MIYLDNAASSGHKPATVMRAVSDALRFYSANPGRSGHKSSVLCAMEIYKARKSIKELVNVQSENDVCFTMNCTHAINTVLYGVLSAGDHIIVSSLEHNAVWRPVKALEKSGRVEVSVANVDMFDDDITLRNFQNLIRKNTKMIFVTAASNVLGRRLPLEGLGALCKQNGILFGVDGAQGVGHFDIDVKKLGIDYLCIAPHKGLYAPTGVGVLVAQSPIERVLISGGTGVNSIDVEQPEELPERIESGTLNIPGILGLRAGVDFVRNKGVSRIESAENKLVRYAYKGLVQAGAELYTSYPSRYLYAPVLSFNIKGFGSDKIGEELNKWGIAVRTGLHCAPLAHSQNGTLTRGTVRISPSVFNSGADIEKLIFVVKKIK